jgi:amino acid adenylation domain-containing protein
MSLRFEMTGALDTGVLQESLTALITRHEALRTRFEEEGGEPFATVVESTPLACPIDDLRGMGEGAEVELERLLTQDEGQPFDLRHAPLLRARLVQMDDARSVLGLTMHHIASDGWSMGVLATDFLAVYESISRGEEPSPGALPFRYRDHVAAERRWLGSPVAERQLEYWRGRLSGALPVVDLPRDYSRPRVQTYRGGTRAHRLSKRLTRRVAELSRAQGVTPFMTLLSAFALLLHRLTGLEDLPIGVPVAGRGRPETDGIVGVFINTVVMRHDLSAAPAFAELLARSRRLALEAYDNAEVPFDRVVEALQPRRDPGRSPLFQVLFNSIDFGGRRRAELPALTVDVSAADSGDSKFDLTLYVGPSEEGTGLMLSFNSDLYRPERMEGLLAQYEFVLEQAVSHPERPVSQISLLAESTRAVLPDPARPLEPWTGPTLTEPFLRHARRNPDRRAVVDVDGILDYGAMERLSAGLAGRLGAAGVSRGDVVALFCPRSRELVWGMLGVLRAGAGFVVLDPDHPPARVLECLRVSKASAWLASPRLGAPDPALGEALDGRQWALRAELGPDLLAGEAPRPDDGDAKPDDMAYVAFTSGTLGGVKGILGTHGPPAHFLSWQSRTFDLNADDRFSLLSGLSHDPLLRDVFAPLHAGATLCVPDPDVVLMPSELRRWLADEAVTVVHLTPSLAGVLADGAEAGVLPGLRYAFLGGEVLTHGVVDALRRLAPSVTVVNFYGATETPQAVGWHGVPSKEDEGEDSSSIPIGQGIDDVQLLVLDQEGGLAGIGELGEIGVRTPHLARGYVADEALTRERFISSPFSQDPGDRIYRTGDLGRYRTDGLVEYAGRRDGQVKIRGYRVEPGAIQQLLRDHPGVRQACVLAVAGDEAAGAGGEVRLVAYLVLDAAEPPTVTDLRRHLRAHVPDYMVPSLFVTLDALPLTPNGKVDRSRLEASSVSSLRSEEVRQPPRTEAERLVAEVWKETLEIESVDVGDNFFDLGGHSLQAIRVLARIEEQTGQRINPRLMIYQTLERFAAGLDVGPLADSSAARGGRGPLRRLWAAISGLRPRAQPESS